MFPQASPRCGRHTVRCGRAQAGERLVEFSGGRRRRPCQLGATAPMSPPPSPGWLPSTLTLKATTAQSDLPGPSELRPETEVPARSPPAPLGRPVSAPWSPTASDAPFPAGPPWRPPCKRAQLSPAGQPGAGCEGSLAPLGGWVAYQIQQPRLWALPLNLEVFIPYVSV